MKINEIVTSAGIIIALILSIVGFYNDYFAEETPQLSIQSFPTSINTFDQEFSFFLYNEGEKPAFIDYIYLDGAEATISPQKDFVVNPLESYKITIYLENPEQSIQTHVYFGEGKISSDKITIS